MPEVRQDGRDLETLGLLPTQEAFDLERPSEVKGAVTEDAVAFHSLDEDGNGLGLEVMRLRGRVAAASLVYKVKRNGFCGFIHFI